MNGAAAADWPSWIALGVSYVVTALGQVSYKLFARTRRYRHAAVGIGFFLIAPVTSYIALRRLPVSTVFVGAATSQVLIMVLSHHVLRERITRSHVLSTALILLGLLAFAAG